jgi:hypothetical protein
MIYHDTGLDAWLRRRQQEYLDDLIRRLARVTIVPVRPIFMEGREIATSPCAAARAQGDLVVMATDGRGPPRVVTPTGGSRFPRPGYRVQIRSLIASAGGYTGAALLGP